MIKQNKNLKNKIKFEIKGTGKETRAFNYIDDFVDGFYKILTKGKHLNIYNIGSQEEVSIIQVAKLVAKYFKKKITITSKSKHYGSTDRRCPNISKIKNELGFKNKVSIDSSIKRFYNWSKIYY